jgi:hypothetical protein
MKVYTYDSLPRTPQELAEDYKTYGGRCHELAQAEVQRDPNLHLVRGYYHCPYWGRRAHWWCEKPDGTIVDPSVRQFPTAGFAAYYEEFDGNVECANCGKVVKEEEASFESNYAFCSHQCHGRFVGVY